MQTQIDVKYVNPPKAGKKWGSIKGANGEQFVGPPETYQFVQPGQRVSVTWKPAPFNEDMKVIEQIAVANAPPAASHETDHRAVEIFVTGVIGRTLQGTGSVPDQATVASMVYSLRKGFEQGMLENRPPATNESAYGSTETPGPLPDDEIPF